MEIDDFPDGLGSGQFLLQPVALGGVRRRAVWFLLVGIDAKELKRAARQSVVTFVAGQSEIVQVGQGIGGHPIMIAEAGKKTVADRAEAVAAEVGRNVFV